MMYLHNDPNGVQVLSFDTDGEAQEISRHLAAMSSGCYFYARGTDKTVMELDTAIDNAVEARRAPDIEEGEVFYPRSSECLRPSGNADPFQKEKP